MPRTPWIEPRTLAPGWRLRISSVAPTTVWLMTAVGPPPCAMTKVPAMVFFSRGEGFQGTLACLAASRNGRNSCMRPKSAQRFWDDGTHKKEDERPRGSDDDDRGLLGHAAEEDDD